MIYNHKKSFVSVSDLLDNTSSVLKAVNTICKKNILPQNKLVGIVLSIPEYNSIQKLSFEKKVATPEDIDVYKRSSHGNGGMEAFGYLKSLR